ncbi:MAG TPA: TetR/AcrR family transcriptional regulator [Candidatus Methylomirabilis sp.]|nr:TetR/AcrR family transcriptional regulator [Candidatus Methylomirabilis sp.]
MARTANEERPGELLDEVAEYLAGNGVADLSLRPLAKAVGSSPRVLLYYFGSKEEMVVKALGRLRERQRVTYERMKSLPYETTSEACRAIWRHMSSPGNARLFRMSLEIFVMALRQRERFADYLRATIEDWLGFLAPPLMKKGYSESEARAHATVVLAGFRGFLLDYCASRDRERVDRAVELWLQGLDAISQRTRVNS